ncbi:MAG TPA: hypothetical protein VJ777_07080, partial [Mycobacterium sp.]|nr:hypothetical protein [Mycobacterium sp.]
RNSWETASTGAKKKTTLKLEDATAGSLFSALNVSLNGTSQVNDGPVATNSVSLLPNYFAGQQIASPGNFQQSSVSVDPLGQWSFTTDPDLTGATHVFRDDLGRLRFWRANPDMSDGTSQGFRYAKYDSIGRITETGVLLNVAEANLAAYAAWARDVDLDTELNAGNSCAVHRFTYDVDPITGTNVAYSQSRGRVTGSTYFPTLVADMPTACPGRGDTDPVNRTYAQFDDLGRTTAQTDVRPGSAGSVMRSTAFAWNVGGMAPTLTYPDMDQTALFVTTGQSSLTSWPTVLGSAVRSCDGADCSGTVYTDLVAFDWLGMALTAQASNGIAQTISYDLRGSALSAVTQKDGATLMQETLRSMQSADNDNPCPGNAATPNFAGGLLIGRQLGGDGLPSQDQGIWSCYGYDGAGRLVETDNYLADGQSWTGQGRSVYAYDPNGNLTSAAIGVSSPAAKQGALRIKPSVLTPAGAAGTAAKPALGSLARTAPDVGAATAMSYVRSGNDQIAQATLASGNQVELAYDPTYGDVMSVASSVAGHAMAISRDPQTRKVVNETIASQSTNAAVLAVDMAYDGLGRRTGRTVSNPATSETSTTDYWYGSGIDPLVIVRDGVSYRVIQGILIEQRQGDAEPVAQYFVFNDHLGSVRMVTDADGAVVESIGYDGDWGLTRIAGQASPSSYDAMTAFWRFQGKEQETFPLSRLGIDDTALAAWLDDMQLYHFHYREYGAGLGAFLAIDPAGQDSSPYMAFGGNPANAVDPDGGWWRPVLLQFLFCVYWGAFWAIAVDQFGESDSIG